VGKFEIKINMAKENKTIIKKSQNNLIFNNQNTFAFYFDELILIIFYLSKQFMD